MIGDAVTKHKKAQRKHKMGLNISPHSCLSSHTFFIFSLSLSLSLPSLTQTLTPKPFRYVFSGDFLHFFRDFLPSVMKGGKSKAESKRGDAKLAVNKKGAAATKGGRKPSKGKAAKDPNKPKRPPSAFFVFMEEFRKQFNKEHPDNKAVSAVGKAAGAKWKSMSDADKAPYVAKAEKRKAEYEKSMRAYNKKQAEGPTGGDEEESEKSVSEVNDEDDDEDGSDEEEDDD
ncbi:hypothetical protein RJT34_08875 [Clitoria ternatea]|uniref:HMG box domain-containing protein n=1 Tax=Clitoria ternatea TaxID=43366 RepID=A0AAN9K756_CLITE